MRPLVPLPEHRLREQAECALQLTELRLTLGRPTPALSRGARPQGARRRSGTACCASCRDFTCEQSKEVSEHFSVLQLFSLRNVRERRYRQLTAILVFANHGNELASGILRQGPLEPKVASVSP